MTHRLTQARLNELLAYGPYSGEFRWRVQRGRTAKVGSIAGYVGGLGYRFIRVDGHKYMAHRLAWLAMYGEWPTMHLDHVNGHRDDNRIENLREATPAQNQHNLMLRKNNKSGVKGVSWDPRQKRWKGIIRANRKTYYLGAFKTLSEAASVVRAAREDLHGEFARHR